MTLFKLWFWWILWIILIAFLVRWRLLYVNGLSNVKHFSCVVLLHNLPSFLSTDIILQKKNKIVSCNQSMCSQRRYWRFWRKPGTFLLPWMCEHCKTALSLCSCISILVTLDILAVNFFINLSRLVFSIFFFVWVLFWREIAGVLMGLSKEFNIDRFLAVLLEALVDNRCELCWFFKSFADVFLHLLIAFEPVVVLSQFFWWYISSCFGIHIGDSSHKEFCWSCCFKGPLVLHENVSEK